MHLDRTPDHHWSKLELWCQLTWNFLHKGQNFLSSPPFSMTKKALVCFSLEHVTGKNKTFMAPLYFRRYLEKFLFPQLVTGYFLSASSALDFFLGSESLAVNKRAGGSSSGLHLGWLWATGNSHYWLSWVLSRQAAWGSTLCWVCVCVCTQDFCILLYAYYILLKCLHQKIEYRKILAVSKKGWVANIHRDAQSDNNLWKKKTFA